MGLKRFLILCSINVSFVVFAQNNLTFANDRFSGINAAVLLPTQTYLNPNPWDINLASADLFFQNDYAYISKQSFLGLSSADIQMASYHDNVTADTQANVMDFYNKNSANLSLNSDILGPSFSMTANLGNKKYVFGLFSRIRTQGSLLGLDNYLRFNNLGVSQPVTFEMSPSLTTAMNWAEIGLNVATEIFPDAENHWLIGANIKYEIGLDAAKINSLETIELTAAEPADPRYINKDIIASGYNIASSYITNYNFDKKQYELKPNGSGAGLNLGIAMLDKDKNEDEYNYKLALNITDLGFVNFATARNHHFQGKPVLLQNNPDLENTEFENPEQYLRILSQQAYGNADASFVGTGLKVGLPTAINFNYSQRIKANHFVNFNWIQRVPVFESSIKRSNIINANYSVQKNAFAYGLSSSLVDYKSLQFGAYVRFGPLIFGSENILPVFLKQDRLHAASVYLALKIYPFWDNEMKRHRRKQCDCEK